MPTVQGSESSMNSADSLIFLMYFLLSWSIFYIFSFAMVIGFSRLIIVIFLAIYQKIDSKKRVKLSKGKLPTVTVIVPAYNEALVISKTIESLSRTKNITPEIIVIDDGSTDDTYAVAKKYENDTNILVYRQENGGK